MSEPDTADRPRSFGYKVGWFAVQAHGPAELANELRLVNPAPANWERGIYEAYAGRMFVTPPVANWVLAISSNILGQEHDWISPVRKTLEHLSFRFGEAQLYFTHRVVEMHVWARSRFGKLDRGYAYLGESGETLWNEGPKSAEEVALGWRFFDEHEADGYESDYWGRQDLVFPDESHVVQIAGAWSLNPTLLEQQFQQPGLGLVGSPASGSQKGSGCFSMA